MSWHNNRGWGYNKGGGKHHPGYKQPLIEYFMDFCRDSDKSGVLTTPTFAFNQLPIEIGDPAGKWYCELTVFDKEKRCQLTYTNMEPQLVKKTAQEQSIVQFFEQRFIPLDVNQFYSTLGEAERQKSHVERLRQQKIIGLTKKQIAERKAQGVGFEYLAQAQGDGNLMNAAVDTLTDEQLLALSQQNVDFGKEVKLLTEDEERRLLIEGGADLAPAIGGGSMSEEESAGKMAADDEYLKYLLPNEDDDDEDMDPDLKQSLGLPPNAKKQRTDKGSAFKGAAGTGANNTGLGQKVEYPNMMPTKGGKWGKFGKLPQQGWGNWKGKGGGKHDIPDWLKNSNQAEMLLRGQSGRLGKKHNPNEIALPGEQFKRAVEAVSKEEEDEEFARMQPPEPLPAGAIPLLPLGGSAGEIREAVARNAIAPEPTNPKFKEEKALPMAGTLMPLPKGDMSITSAIIKQAVTKAPEAKDDPKLRAAMKREKIVQEAAKRFEMAQSRGQFLDPKPGFAYRTFKLVTGVEIPEPVLNIQGLWSVVDPQARPAGSAVAEARGVGIGAPAFQPQEGRGGETAGDNDS
ncbi:unnamed protein product, partial [Amoebophrya sp. A120]|eukprot:GSA120T00004615001.1